MKIILSIFLLTTITLSGFAQRTEIPKQNIPANYGYIVEIGQQIPDITLELTDGTIVTTASLIGKVVMLQFTASWCSVCRKEMPHIEKYIWLKHKDKANFALFGIDMDEPLAKVKSFQETMQTTYPIALDPGAKIFYTFAAKGAGVTRNVIIDKTGKIVYMTRLFKEDEFKEMVEVINLLLDK